MDELPLLEEPLPVEFANSWYLDGDDWVEFLGDDDAVARWFAAVIGPAPAVPAAKVRALRDAVRAVLEAAVDGRRPADAQIQRVNAAAARDPAVPRLRWTNSGPAADPGDQDLLARIAGEAIALVTGPAARDLRRCTAPGCAMLFVKQHPRRAWCNPSCGARVRQARYYRRHRTSPAEPSVG
jgi:predicted RNA-binding Zn ribbon-like protein